MTRTAPLHTFGLLRLSQPTPAKSLYRIRIVCGTSLTPLADDQRIWFETHRAHSSTAYSILGGGIWVRPRRS